MKTEDPDSRRRELATIHLGAKALGMERDVYEDMLFSLARVRSARALDSAGRKRFMDHIRACGGFHGKHRRSNPEWGWVDRAAEDRRAMLKKVIMLAKSGGYSKKYVDGTCVHMFGIERLELVAPADLHKLIAALVKDQQRRAARV